MNIPRKTTTPLYAKLLGPLTGLFPNFDFFFIKAVRQKASDLLYLKPGDRVLDAGCGSGGSFPYLVRAVGTEGEVVGVEISPDSSASAVRRAASNGWKNVRVIEGAAQEVQPTGLFDGLIMFATPDIYCSKEALNNLIPHLKNNARVVVFGAKRSRHRFGQMLNPLLHLAFKLSFSTTPRPDYDPLRVLAAYTNDVVVEDYFLGLMFLASGSVERR